MNKFNKKFFKLNTGKSIKSEIKNVCAAGHYTSNMVVLHGALVCWGGFGQPKCEHCTDCLADNGFKLSKTGRRIKMRREK
jgi:hypothetical protein